MMEAVQHSDDEADERPPRNHFQAVFTFDDGSTRTFYVGGFMQLDDAANGEAEHGWDARGIDLGSIQSVAMTRCEPHEDGEVTAEGFRSQEANIAKCEVQ